MAAHRREQHSHGLAPLSKRRRVQARELLGLEPMDDPSLSLTSGDDSRGGGSETADESSGDGFSTAMPVTGREREREKEREREIE